ncbi:pentalenolactone synthase [Actinoallomurus soli]|uniref:pentalenolactone synthase n=1 Tax=Actinoallomurus soli TaxID=2952535 RepID=UPI002092859F|nr:cytochrome P450 [Actinoallomurus soli]MCO5975061.1 cytochrome P450 [Actinoallomurus soli]
MTELPNLPFDKPSLLGIAPQLRELQEEGPIARVRTAAGEEVWLVTRYDEVKALLAGGRLGRSHPDPEQATKVRLSALLAADDYDNEETNHAQMRALLVPRFSARRMRALKPRIEHFVDDLLDRLAARTPPADLHPALSSPLPVMVICELLGVPFADWERFRRWSTGITDLDDNQHSVDSTQQLVDYMADLVARKRTEPGDDMLSELITEQDGALSDADIAQLGAVVLFAGTETTVVRIDLGTLLLLSNPAQRALLAENPELVQTAVEEILRLGVGDSGLRASPRYARSDITLGDTVIRTGDAVLLAIGAANRDGRVFPDADRFDLVRDKPNPHLAFGYGARYCIGASLARIELTAVFERLFRRLPDLRLAVPVESLRWREDLLTGGFEELPVTF